MSAYRDEDEDVWDPDDDAGIGDDSDDELTVPCPYCRREILEDVPQCPYCERYISEEDHAGLKQPLWVIATALVLLGIAVWWAFGTF